MLGRCALARTLGVALLGSLLVSSLAGGAATASQAPTLHAVLAVAGIGYVIAVALAWFAIRPAS